MFTRKRQPETVLTVAQPTEVREPYKIGPGRPPKEHQFKPGDEWRGNPGGRPKILFEESAAYLREIDPDTGKTNARVLVEKMGEIAREKGGFGISAAAVNAFRSIKDVAEPEEQAAGAGISDKAMIRLFAELLMERKVNAIEINPHGTQVR